MAWRVLILGGGVVSLGSISRTLPVPGLREHAVGFKTLPDAIALHNRVLQSMEIAETLEDPAERRACLTYVFVGAGYAGLEGLAELQDMAVDAIERYPRCRLQGMRWILVEARDRVMYEISPDLAEFASDQLRARGIEIRTFTVVEEVGDGFVRLAPAADVGPPAETVPARTVAWTTGLAMMPGVGRRLRLIIDWTVGLAFGRDVAEVGQLGHAPRLGEDEVASPAAGRTVPVGAPSGPPPGPEA